MAPGSERLRQEAAEPGRTKPVTFYRANRSRIDAVVLDYAAGNQAQGVIRIQAVHIDLAAVMISNLVNQS